MLKYFIAFVAVLSVVFLVGPRVNFPELKLLDSDIKAGLQDLDSFIAQNESLVTDLKPDNEARIVWADSMHQPTEYALVYLHGFSASIGEGDPLHTDFAKRYGMNLYISRLADHGRRDTNSFEYLTPDAYMQSAEDALDVSKKLGKKVIVMACSTGCTQAIALAAAGEDIHSMIFYSPNIDIFDSKSSLLLGPWGKQLSKLVLGGNHNHVVYDSTAQKYWNSVYHSNGIFVVKALIHDYMNAETFAKVGIPVFMGYYYKDEDHQDNVVSVQRMLEFYDQLGTKDELKQKVAFPEAGNHVICSSMLSKDIDQVRTSTFKFAEEVLKLKPKITKQ